MFVPFVVRRKVGMSSWMVPRIRPERVDMSILVEGVPIVVDILSVTFDFDLVLLSKLHVLPLL